LFFSTLIIGNVVSFTALWIGFREYSNTRILPFIILTLIAADLIGDILWYSLGRLGRDTRFGNFLHNHLPRQKKIETHIQKSSRQWIFLSKYIPSSTFAIIFSVGWARVEFKKFWPVSLAAIFSSLAIIIGLSWGLSAGLSLLEAVAFFKRFERILLVGVILFVAVSYIISKGITKILTGKTD